MRTRRSRHRLALAVAAAQLVVAGLLVVSAGGDRALLVPLALAGCLCAVAALRRAVHR